MSRLVRALGRRDLVAMLINGVVGAGILGLPAKTFELVGVYSIAGWLACALIMGLIALCCAEVGSRFSETGGPYLYTLTAFGPGPGFMVGWLGWTSRLFSVATIGNLSVNYAAAFLPALNSGVPRLLFVTLLSLALALIVLSGVRRSAVVNNLLTVCKLAVLIGFVVGGSFFVKLDHVVVPSIPPIGDWQASLLLMSFAFIGIETAIINGGEIRDPRRDVPFALGAGLFTVALLYLSIQIVCIGVIPDLARSERPVVEAVALLSPTAGAIVNVGALVMMFGTMLAVLLSGSRLPFALAEQGQLPQALSSVGERFNSPTIAIILTAVCAWLLMIYTSFLGALAATALTRLLTYAAACACLIRLRSRESLAQPAAYRAPAGALTAVLGIIACVWLMASATTKDFVVLAIVILIGAAIGAGYRQMHGPATLRSADISAE